MLRLLHMCVNLLPTSSNSAVLIVEFKVTGGSNSLRRVLSFTPGDEEHHMSFLELAVHRRVRQTPACEN